MWQRLLAEYLTVWLYKSIWFKLFLSIFFIEKGITDYRDNWNETRMTPFIKAKLKKSDGQTNIDRCRVAAHRLLQCSAVYYKCIRVQKAEFEINFDNFEIPKLMSLKA